MRARSLLTLLVLATARPAAAVSAALPRLELEGKTDGSATVSVSAGLTFPWAGEERVDITPWVTYEVSSSDGLGTLFSFQESSDGAQVTTPKPWSLGGTLSIRWWGSNPPAVPKEERDAAQANAYGVCAAQCRGVAPIDDGGAFCGLRKSKVAAAASDWLDDRVDRLKGGDFCEEQRKAMVELDQVVAQGLVAPEVAREKRKEALAACMAPCAPDSVQGMGRRTFCAPLGPMPQEIAPGAFNPDQLCKAGKAIKEGLEKRHPETISHSQRLLVNLGGRGGGATFKHLAPDPANPGQLAPTTTNVRSWSLGGSGAWLFAPGGPTATLEVLAVHSFDHQGADDKARYCLPAGDVSAPGGGAVPATTCTELDASAPVAFHETRFAVLLGWFDQVRNAWRLSFGADLDRRADHAWRTTFQAPIHVKVAGDLSYQGLVRITPSIAFGGDPKEGTVYAISIALLGQRGFFAEKFDSL